MPSSTSLARLFIGHHPTNDQRRSGRETEKRKATLVPRSSLTSGKAGPGARGKAIGGNARGLRFAIGDPGCPSARGSSQSVAGGGGCLAVGGGGEANGCFQRRPSPPAALLPSAAARKDDDANGSRCRPVRRASSTVEGWAVFLRGGGGRASGPSVAAVRPGPRLLRATQAFPVPHEGEPEKPCGESRRCLQPWSS